MQAYTSKQPIFLPLPSILARSEVNTGVVIHNLLKTAYSLVPMKAAIPMHVYLERV